MEEDLEKKKEGIDCVHQEGVVHDARQLDDRRK
jgi:hypothetical protein